MKKISLTHLILIIILFSFISCVVSTSFVKTSYDVLAVSQTSYDTSMKAAADLYKQGIFGEEVKTKILNVAKVFQNSHNAAVETLAKYKETGSLKDKELLEKQISLVSEALANLLTIIKPFLEE